MVVAPGFIDLHSHSDYPLQNKATRANLSFAYQGATTVVTGNCGAGPADVAKYFAALEKNGVGCNVIHLMPHNTVRKQVMTNANRAPSPAELKMEAILERGMTDGAWGMATGLIYTPGSYSKTDELIALSKVIAKHGGIYASHIRDEGSGVLGAIDEALRIGKEAGLPVHISHLKASGKSVWGKSADIVAAIAAARKAGQVVTADQYPYTASSTSLAATLIPTRWREGTDADFQSALADPDLGPQIKEAMERALKARRRLVGADRPLLEEPGLAGQRPRRHRRYGKEDAFGDRLRG
ncbi:MAG: amidohydrolase family protein [Gemmataceae bacterium]